LYQNPKQPSEQTTWEKKPRKTVKKMELNRSRPLGLMLDEDEEEEEESVLNTHLNIKFI
jgi:hypothetical protein